ncbi:MAG: hypothetical protein GY861_03180 [bacterium]|nr:hypothetical protein [bacterium]
MTNNYLTIYNPIWSCIGERNVPVSVGNNTILKMINIPMSRNGIDRRTKVYKELMKNKPSVANGLYGEVKINNDKEKLT